MRKNFSLRIYKTSHNQKITEKVQKGNRKLKSHLYHYISEDKGHVVFTIKNLHRRQKLAGENTSSPS